MFTLPKLPYPINGLEPVFSEKQLSLHYHKYHQAYVDKLNKLVGNSRGFVYDDLIYNIRNCTGPLFNNSAQHWNHSFFWKSMKTPEQIKPASLVLTDAVNNSFGNIKILTDAWIDFSMRHFGSGWTWLVYNPGEKLLYIRTTHDADNPYQQNEIPLLNSDLWEHCYFYDFHNKKEEYLRAFIGKLANWQFASENYELARIK